MNAILAEIFYTDTDDNLYDTDRKLLNSRY